MSGQSESAVNRVVSLTDDRDACRLTSQFSVLEESVKVSPKRSRLPRHNPWRDTEGTTRTRVHQRLKVHREDKRPTFPRWPQTRTPSMG